MITNQQIWNLRVQAAEARDDAKVVVCDHALGLWQDRPDPHARKVTAELMAMMGLQADPIAQLTREDARALCARWITAV